MSVRPKRFMSKRLRRLAATALTGALVFSMGTSVFAASGDGDPSVKGAHTYFDKYLVMETYASVPNYTSIYQISAGPAVAGTKDTPEVYRGVGADQVTITQTEAFYPGQQTFATVQGGDTVELSAGEKYAVQSVDVDFSRVNFSQPGIYRYLVQEISDTKDQGITIDPDDDRYLDVYVDSAEDGTLTVLGYVLHDDTRETTADKPDYQLVPQAQVNEHYNYYVVNSASDPSKGYHLATASEKADAAVKKYTAVTTYKDAGFENTYTTYDLTLEKQVTGNQGNRKEYFEFTLKLTGGVPNTRYMVDLDEATKDGIAYTLNGTQTVTKSNVSQLSTAGRDEDLGGRYFFTTDDTGSKELVFYLKDDQKIKIYGITSATKYEVTETKKQGEGYIEAYTVTHAEGASGEKVLSNQIFTTPMGENDTFVEFENERTGVIPTGIMMSVAPYVLATACASAGVVTFSKKKKKR